MDSLREFRFVTEYDTDGPKSQQIMRALKAAGVELLSFSTRAVCRACRGSGSVDAGPIGGSLCMRRSKPCADCDGSGQNRKVASEVGSAVRGS